MNQSELNAHIGRRLRMERRRRDLTLKQLSCACGISFQQVQRYEQGEAALSASMLFTLAEALCVRVADLFPRQESAAAAEPACGCPAPPDPVLA